MIVKVDNSNFNLYSKFFAEAYKYLEEIEAKDNRIIIADIDRSEEKTFTSITQYFKYIEEFKNSPKRDYFLLKLPLDEGIFEIDANTRNITIPASFIKSSIVQRDKIAETIVFTIDRFIDNIDLCNVNQVYVQWSAPDGFGGIREWATPIELIDRESIPEKIKFGWTIDEAVTLYPGKVSFSITFFISDEQEVGKVLYRLNTLPATLEIKPALQPEINSNSTINRPGSALNAVIRNNKYPGQGIKAPIVPEFNEPGLDLPTESMLIGEGAGTLTLKAQAVANDEGSIGYVWYFIPENGEFKYRCGENLLNSDSTYSLTFKALTSQNKEHLLKKADFLLLTDTSKAFFENSDKDQLEYSLISKEDTILYYNVIGTVGIEYEKIDNLDKMDPREKLYVKLDNDVWEIYSGTPEQEDLDKYEKYTTFTVPDNGSVVGQYFVEADNTIVSNTSNPQQSTTCYLNGPEEIVILQDLPESIFIEKEKFYNKTETLTQDQYDLILNPNKEDLFEKIEKDGKYYYNAKQNGTKVILKNYDLELKLRPTENTSFIYDWYKSLTKNTLEQQVLESDQKIIGVNSEVLSISEPSWYLVDVSAKKNREEKNERSKICRALVEPVVPTLKIVEYYGEEDEFIANSTTKGQWINVDEENGGFYQIDVPKNVDVKLVVNGTIDVNGIDKQTDKLYCDQIKYEWRIFDEEKGEQVILNSNDELLPGNSNTDFKDKLPDEDFSNHPKAITYKSNGKQIDITCFAINTLDTRNTINKPAAVSFRIV